MPAKEISDIVSELMEVGALIPEPKIVKCYEAHNYLIDGILEARTLAHGLMFTPREDIKNWDIARIDGQRQLIQSLKEQGFFYATDATTFETDLTSAIEAIKKSDWITAVDRLQRYATAVETLLPTWLSNCACAKKGDIISSICYGVGIHKEVDPTHKNIIWQDTVVALNRIGILTREEADKLIKEVRW